MIYIKACFLLSTLLIAFKSIMYLLTIFQQEHYYSKNLLKTLYSFYFKKKFNYLLYINILISYIDNIYLYVFGILISLISLFITDKTTLKLKVTNRIKRMIITIIVIYIILIILPLKLSLSLTLFNPFIVIISNFINFPVETLIRKKYIKNAKKKLKDLDLVKIAITGSYGKTSTKNIISSILESKYICLKTPKSFNTIMGITKVINKSLYNTHEVFVCEMGATHKKEIEQMTKLINPSIAIITDIGPQHLDSFKTVNNVLDAKFELIDNMNSDGYAILNGDNCLIKERKITNIKNIIYYGLKETNDIYATNIKVINGITKFSVYYKKELYIDIETKLLGEHNIKNILAMLATTIILNGTHNLNIEKENLREEIKELNPTKHRLSYKKIDNIHLYDDSYNSNIVGFEKAVDVIKNTPYKKIIITPGIVDCGKKTKELNELTTKYIEGVFDDIYVIDNYSGRFIYKKLEHLKQVHLFPSFFDAYQDVISKYKTEEISLLIENDLPDNYYMRGK